MTDKAIASSTRSKSKGQVQRMTPANFLSPKTPEKDVITATPTPASRRALSLTTEGDNGQGFFLKTTADPFRSTIVEKIFANTGPRAH